MGFLRCHLVSVETLHAVSAYDSTRLVEAQLGNVELLSCVLHVAVDPGGEVLLLRFLLVGGIGNDVRQCLCRSASEKSRFLVFSGLPIYDKGSPGLPRIRLIFVTAILTSSFPA